MGRRPGAKTPHCRTVALPSGLGYLSDGHYYQPLTTGQVMAINTSDGAAADAVKSSSVSVGGNLICHRGSILSQSAPFLEKFEQIEVLRERAKAALAANPQDAAAIRDLAEMRRLDGALDEAVPMLKQAYKIDAADVLTREMLADTLLEALGRDYAAYRADLPLLRKIVSGPQQEIELLRLEAQGLEAAGETLQAFDAYLRLVDATSSDLTTLTIGPQYLARSDCWIRARLGSLWQSAGDADRATMKQALADRRAKWANPPSASELREYLAYFGGLPESSTLQLQLARNFGKDFEALESELELLRMDRSTAAPQRAAGAILLTQWLLEEGRLEEAAAAAAEVEATWSDTGEVDGKPLSEWLANWKKELSTAGVKHKAWPRGRATIQDLPVTAANRRDVTRRAQDEFQLGLRRLRVEQTSPPALGPTQWFISQDGSRLIGRDGFGRDIFRFNASRRSRLRRFVGNADLVQAAQLGDVLYVTLGGQVVAIDSRQRGRNDDSDILWRSNPAGRIAVVRSGRAGNRPIYHTWSQRRRVPGAAGGFFASLGPATPNGVVFQDQQRLRSVDPLSGETLWSRDDVPPGCELFGDDEYVLAADAEGEKLYVVRLSDGELVEQRALPETPWLLTSGRNIAQLLDTKDGTLARKTLRIVDAVSGEKRFEASYVPAVRMTTLEPNLVAVVDPGGKFELIDIRTNERLIEHELPLTAAPRSLAVLQAGNNLYLGLNSAARQQASRPIGLDYPLVDGQVFAFDLASGEPLWPGAAVIEARGMALSQPTDIPVLVFVDRLLKRDASGGGHQAASVVHRSEDREPLSIATTICRIYLAAKCGFARSATNRMRSIWK